MNEIQINNNINDDAEVLSAIMKDRAVRQAVTRESHGLFFHLYFPHYVKYPTAEFQKDIFRITEDKSNKLACIVAFRGSAKSTLVTLSYALWSILGSHQKKFVLIICQTQSQAKQHMMNLRRELEDNKLLKSDLGPFQEEIGGEWAITSLVFKNTGARITIASLDQSIRGLRHHEHRPDLIILDDVEDLKSTRTSESRNQTWEWFTREVMPLGDLGTRVIILANLLHEDSLVMRLKRKIDASELNGIFKSYPLLNETGECLWPEKFDNPGKIEELRQSVANELAWQQEYLLNIISDSTKVIHSDWIQYYDKLPPFDDDHDFRFTATGIDLAISQRDSADYTAMVSAHVYGFDDKVKIYIASNPVNQRMTHKETMDTAMIVSKSLGKGEMTWILVEDVGYQAAVAQELKRLGYPAKAVKVHGSDKRSRLALTSHLVQNGTVLFPCQGVELLLTQLVGFGVERFDDLADAFSLLVNRIIALDHKEERSGFGL
ncbi:MAG: hypothetical protein V1719_02080 [Patescibacteria group bacterium]